MEIRIEYDGNKKWPVAIFDNLEIPFYHQMLKNLEQPDCCWHWACCQRIAFLPHTEFRELVKIIKNQGGWSKEEVYRLYCVRSRIEEQEIEYWYDHV